MRPAVTAMLPPESGRAVETLTEVKKKHYYSKSRSNHSTSEYHMVPLVNVDSEITTQCIYVNSLSEMQDKKQSEDNSVFQLTY